MSCRDLVRRIEKQLCLPKRYGTNDERLEEICEFFNVNRGYLMIVDEADKLINKYTIKKIELLRTIMDSAAVGMVLAGELSLEAHLAAYDERFANRMDLRTGSMAWENRGRALPGGLERGGEGHGGADQPGQEQQERLFPAV